MLQTQLILTVTRVFQGYHLMLYIALETLSVVSSIVGELRCSLSMDVCDFLKTYITSLNNYQKVYQM